MENNLKFSISEFSDFNRKLSSLEKIYLLQDLYSSTRRHVQIAKKFKHLLHPGLQISSNYLTTTENQLSTQEETFTDSIVIYKLLNPQLHWTLQVRSIIILVPHIPPTIIEKLSIQLLQLYAWDRRVFENYVEELNTRMMPASSVALNYSHQVLEKDESNQRPPSQWTNWYTKRTEQTTSSRSLQIQNLSSQNHPCGFRYHGQT